MCSQSVRCCRKLRYQEDCSTGVYILQQKTDSVKQRCAYCTSTIGDKPDLLVPTK